MRMKLQAAQSKASGLENRHLALQKTIHDLESKLCFQIETQAKLKQQMENEKNELNIKLIENNKKYSNSMKVLKDEKEKNIRKHFLFIFVNHFHNGILKITKFLTSSSFIN